jgi:hypothetical protein
MQARRLAYTHSLSRDPEITPRLRFRAAFVDIARAIRARRRVRHEFAKIDENYRRLCGPGAFAASGPLAPRRSQTRRPPTASHPPSPALRADDGRPDQRRCLWGNADDPVNSIRPELPGPRQRIRSAAAPTARDRTRRPVTDAARQSRELAGHLEFDWESPV